MAAWDISGKVVLITGAARGIGEGTARALAARGAKVALVGLEPERLERVAGEIGGEAFWHECDVTDRASVDAAVAATVERYGGVDCAIANAGIAIPGFARSMDPDAFERVIQVNLLGVWRTLHAALPHVLERRGYLLGIASEAALAPFPGAASYGTAKAAVEQLCNSLRLELKHLGVDVGVAYFHFIDTDMVRGSDASPVSGLMRSKAKGVFKKTYPLAGAVDAVVEGVEHRAHRVVHPGWLRWMILFRGFVPKLAESQILAAVPEADRVAAEHAERLGATAATQAVGAGGEADAAARERSATPAGGA
ncbi:MAG TPA: SDR family oxidoreductase [Solirubrobacteraceae bacterium]|nr:SDR family oxidoreductase [Solirubrobacteraceae bacterium]